MLLVEDDLEDVILLRHTLERASVHTCAVEVAADLASAARLLARGHFDLILTDLNMPGVSGLQAVTTLQKIAPRHPIVVMTGAQAELLGVEAIKAGAQDYLVKGSADGASVWRTLRYAIERARAEALHRTVVSVLCEGVTVHDRFEGAITSNAAAENILGKFCPSVVDRLIATPEIRLVREDGTRLPDVDDPVFSTMHTGKAVTDLVVGLSRSGAPLVWLSINTQPVFEAGAAEPRLVVCSFHNITERKLSEERLRASLHDKEILLREVHHRVKNNMQVISSLLSLQAMEVESEEIRTMFEDSQSRIRTMALIHERLYRSGDLAQVDFPEYLKNLVAMVFRSQQTGCVVTTHVDVDSVSIDLDTAIPLGLITNELLANTLKYAFPRRPTGEVWVTLQRTGTGELEFVVADDGAQTPGAAGYDANSGLGLKLVDVLTRQIKGRLSVLRAKGTRFTILFPAPHSAPSVA